MEKINPKQLAQDIDALPDTCKEGKEAIKRIFENNFGVKFPKPTLPKVGDVYYDSNESVYYVITQGVNGELRIAYFEDQGRVTEAGIMDDLVKVGTASVKFFKETKIN